MCEPYFLPLIHAVQYDAFRSLLGDDLPNTYDEWLQLHANEKRERSMVGFDVREIQVDPHEFARYCGARGIAADGLRLLHFAAEKGSGNRY